MHGLIFETSVWLLAESTRLLPFHQLRHHATPREDNNQSAWRTQANEKTSPSASQDHWERFCRATQLSLVLSTQKKPIRTYPCLTRTINQVLAVGCAPIDGPMSNTVPGSMTVQHLSFPSHDRQANGWIYYSALRNSKTTPLCVITSRWNMTTVKVVYYDFSERGEKRFHKTWNQNQSLIVIIRLRCTAPTCLLHNSAVN